MKKKKTRKVELNPRHQFIADSRGRWKNRQLKMVRESNLMTKSPYLTVRFANHAVNSGKTTFPLSSGFICRLGSSGFNAWSFQIPVLQLRGDCKLKTVWTYLTPRQLNLW
jgi:hypothetical protein